MKRKPMTAAQRKKIGDAVRAANARRQAEKGQQWTTARKGKPARIVSIKQARVAKKTPVYATSGDRSAVIFEVEMVGLELRGGQPFATVRIVADSFNATELLNSGKPLALVLGDRKDAQ